MIRFWPKVISSSIIVELSTLSTVFSIASFSTLQLLNSITDDPSALEQNSNAVLISVKLDSNRGFRNSLSIRDPYVRRDDSVMPHDLITGNFRVSREDPTNK